jgi:hypothetical protein
MTDFIDKHRYINVDYDDWHECTSDHWVEKLQEQGFHNVETGFTGFYSQGDGASFTGRLFHTGLVKFMELHGLAQRYPHMFVMAQQQLISYNIYRTTHHYYHEHTVNIEGELDTIYEPEDETDLRENALYEVYCKAEYELTDLARDILETSRGLMQDMYSDLRTDYEYLTSDEAVRETLMINDIAA